MTTMPATAGRAEQTRARYPDDEGYVERDGVRVFWEVYGERRADDPAAAHLVDRPLAALEGADPVPRPPRRVLTFDPRGNGRSDRPAAVEAYAEREFAADALAVLDATGTERAVVVGALARARCGRCCSPPSTPSGSRPRCSSRPAVPLAPATPRARGRAASTRSSRPTRAGRSSTATTGASDYRDFLEFFFGQMFNEPHSTKQIEDGVGWGLETDAETLRRPTRRPSSHERGGSSRGSARAIACPVLVIHGDRRRSGRSRAGAALAEATGGELVALEGSGHCPHARDPVAVNRLLREFVAPRRRAAQLDRADAARRKRALYISSPIGLGHARRDIAIARELRRCTPTSRSTGSRSTR